MIADGCFALVRTTLLDFPGRVATAVFLPGCHLRCPYCHNPEFVDPIFFSSRQFSSEFEDSPFNADIGTLKTFLEKRAARLGGIVFSGGEALLHPLLPELIDMASGFKLPVKLDTAGLLPERLATLLESDSLAYVAVDLKTLPSRYGELGWHDSGISAASRLDKTITLLNESGIDFEIRTTVVPGLVDIQVLHHLMPLASRAPVWILQAYAPGHTLNPDWGALKAPDDSDLEEMAGILRVETDSEIRVR